MKKSQLKELIKLIIKESTEPSIGGSYGDQQTGVDSSNVRPERDSLNDPMLKEYSDPQSRLKAIKGRPDDALKLIFVWVKQGHINFNEFEDLANQWAEMTDQSNRSAS